MLYDRDFFGVEKVVAVKEQVLLVVSKFDVDWGTVGSAIGDDEITVQGEEYQVKPIEEVFKLWNNEVEWVLVMRIPTRVPVDQEFGRIWTFPLDGP